MFRRLIPRVAAATAFAGTTAFALSAPRFKPDIPVSMGSEDASDDNEVNRMLSLMGLLFKPHPWHGLNLGPSSPDTVIAYIECVPGEGIKYEIDKATGYIIVDRPHKYSSLCPTIYGFLPQTYCGQRVAERCMERTGLKNIKGDGDPIDICVLSTRQLSRGDCILRARPIGGLRMIDGGEADDKIIAVIEGDSVMSDWKDVTDIPKAQLDVIRHYFLTYKQGPDMKEVPVTVPEVYGRTEACQMIARSSEDYHENFSHVKHEFARSILGGIKRELARTLFNA
jgi:inorganic pyrophosphatase